MPGFRHTLIGVNPLCDADCTVTFTLVAVIIRDAHGSPVLTGWREQYGPHLWIIALRPGKSNLPNMPHDENRTVQPGRGRPGRIRKSVGTSNNYPLTNTANFSTTLNSIRTKSTTQATSIIDSGATDIYFSADAPMVNIDRSAPKVTVGTTTGQTQNSTGTGELNLLKLPSGFAVTGHIMPGFRHILNRCRPAM